MTKLIVLNSRHLENTEVKSEDPGYKHSTHKSATRRIISDLNSLDIKHIVWDEPEINRLGPPHTTEPGIIIVPPMRVCSDEAYAKLLALAESGWIVFTSIDSMYFTRVENTAISKRVQTERVPALFQLKIDASVASRLLSKGIISFPSTRFSWLTNGLSSSSQYQGYIQAIDGEGSLLSTHGRIEVKEAKNNQDSSIDQNLKGKYLPAFAIREYSNTGLFIYACFSLSKLNDSKQIFKNLISHRNSASTTKEVTFPNEGRALKRQVRILKTAVVVLSALCSLLLARELIGDTLSVYIGGVVAGTVLGITGNFLTDVIKRFLSGR